MHRKSCSGMKKIILRGPFGFDSIGLVRRHCDDNRPTARPAILLRWSRGHNVKSTVQFPACHHASYSCPRLKWKPFRLSVIVANHETVGRNHDFFGAPWSPRPGLQLVGMDPAPVRVTVPFAAFSPDDPIDFFVSMNDWQKATGFAEDNLFAFNFDTVAHYDLRAR